MIHSTGGFDRDLSKNRWDIRIVQKQMDDGYDPVDRRHDPERPNLDSARTDWQF